MTPLDLYKFIQRNNVEYHWDSNNEDVFICLGFDIIPQFHKLLPSKFFDDDGLPCTIKDGYLVIEMKYICDYYDIDLKDIFGKEKEQ